MKNYFCKQITEQMRLLVSIIKQLQFCFQPFLPIHTMRLIFLLSLGKVSTSSPFSYYLCFWLYQVHAKQGSREVLLNKSCCQHSLVLAGGKWQVVGSLQTLPLPGIPLQQFLYKWVVSLQLVVLGDIHQPLQMDLLNLFKSCLG